MAKAITKPMAPKAVKTASTSKASKPANTTHKAAKAPKHCAHSPISLPDTSKASIRKPNLETKQLDSKRPVHGIRRFPKETLRPNLQTKELDSKRPASGIRRFPKEIPGPNRKTEKPDPKKQASGIRRYPKGTDDSLLSCISKMHAMGIVECPKTLLALDAGYSNPQSSGYKKAINGLIESGLVEACEKKDHWKLGIGEEKDDDTPDNAKVQERLLGLLKKKAKNDKTEEFWNVLLDGGSHTDDKLAIASGFDSKRSPKFLDLVLSVLELGLATKEGTVVQLVDFVFPEGRPT